MKRPNLLPRRVKPRLIEALASSRAVGVIGPRQAGKTTLVRDLIAEEFPASYSTLDDPATRAFALDDPVGFVAGLDGPAVIDEIQRAPELMLVIKMRMDQDPRPGQFLITGSANIITLPTIRDALPGRVRYVHLWPFAQVEIEQRGGNLVDELFDRKFVIEDLGGADPRSVATRIVSGGYPSAYRQPPGERRAGFEAYADSVAGRDMQDFVRLRDVATVGRLLRLLAARSATLLSRRSLAQDLGVDPKTAAHHLGILQELMLVRIHPAWHTSLSQREIKTPKVYLTDTGMLAALVGADEERISSDPNIRGMAFETFVVMELVKLAGWSESSPRLYHYRDRDGHEVDVVIERPGGEIVGVEVKAGATVTPSDFRALTRLRERSGSKFRSGVVFYGGAKRLPFRDRMWAMPISALWS